MLNSRMLNTKLHYVKRTAVKLRVLSILSTLPVFAQFPAHTRTRSHFNANVLRLPQLQLVCYAFNGEQRPCVKSKRSQITLGSINGKRQRHLLHFQRGLQCQTARLQAHTYTHMGSSSYAHTCAHSVRCHWEQQQARAPLTTAITAALPPPTHGLVLTVS